jgi:hypothetical protein
MPVRCAIYARYSSDQQRPESIEDQIRHCRQEAARHPDWVILGEHVYSDQAITGASVEGRAGLAQLTAAARVTPRPFDKVLFDDVATCPRRGRYPLAPPGPAISRHRVLFRQSGARLRPRQRGFLRHHLWRDGCRVHPRVRAQDAPRLGGASPQGFQRRGLALWLPARGHFRSAGD